MSRPQFENLNYNVCFVIYFLTLSSSFLANQIQLRMRTFETTVPKIEMLLEMKFKSNTLVYIATVSSGLVLIFHHRIFPPRTCLMLECTKP
jgi:hypothetical protein